MSCSSRNETILVVYDETAVGAVVNVILDKAGYNVLLAGSAPEALGLVNGHRVDAVLTDLVMRGMGGAELILRMRQRWPRVAALHPSERRYLRAPGGSRGEYPE